MSSIKENGGYVDILAAHVKSSGAYIEAQKVSKKISGSYTTIYEKEAQQPSLNIPSGALVALTPDSAYNSSGSIAQNGENVAEWRNLITGNGTVAATQADTARQPVMEEVNGLKQLKFAGSGDFLDFGITPELDFPSPSTDYTIVMVCGTGVNKTYWSGSISGSSGQFAIAFTSSMFFHDGNTFRGFSEPAPTVPEMVTVQRRNADNKSIVYMGDTQRLDQTSTVTQGNTTLSTLIGSRHNNDPNSLNGSLRYFLVWKRVLTQQEITDLYAELV